MSDRKATIQKIQRIHPHPNADALEFADVLGYQCIVRKGQYTAGDLVVYIPEQTLVPEYILRNLGLWNDVDGIGKLAGPEGNRVKAIKLRGETSLGLLYPISDGTLCNEYGIEEAMTVTEDDIGTDVSEFLYITKWEPTVPTNMDGEVCALPGKTIRYNIENVKNYPDILDALITLGVPCAVTEKLHGTWCCFGYFPDKRRYQKGYKQLIHEEIPGGNTIVTSKGMSAKELVFKDNEANANNLYMKMFHKFNEEFDIKSIVSSILYNDTGLIANYDEADPVYIVGEIYGKGVQDLTYGLEEAHFRVFDVYVGKPNNGFYVPHDIMASKMETRGIETVPELYRGKLNHELVRDLTNGMDTITGTNIREGVVIKPLKFQLYNSAIGRIILKSISDNYLNRKNGSEYN